MSQPSLDANALLEQLDPQQRQVAQSLRGPVAVLAGAGTGKTRAITYRIAYGIACGVHDPSRLLAVTFTARAAAEMRSRLRQLGVGQVQARTFHSAALRQLRYFWPQAIGGEVPRLVDHKAALVGEAAGRLSLGVDRSAIRDLASEIEWAKVSMIDSQNYAEQARTQGRLDVAGFDSLTISRLLAVYEEVKTERGVIDFEDVLLLMVGIMLEHDDIAEQVRAQYRTFVVDEYQDVSTLQQRLLDLWLGERKDLCVVGDVSQTIYSFAGATPRFLTDFKRRYSDATVVQLVRDYRSTPQVVDLANKVLGKAGRHRNAAAVELISQRPAGPQIQYRAFSDDEAEATGIAAAIDRQIKGGVPAAQIAVLYRTNAQSEQFEQALASAGIGYLVRGGERFFSRREVRDALTLLRGSARTRGTEPAHRTTEDILTSAGWNPTPPPTTGAVRERWDSLNALLGLAQELEETRGATFAEFVAELLERAQAQHAPEVDGVTLASLHAAKGLEWEAVHLAGVSDGLLPISMAESVEQIEEERRLLYVGITRARTQLQLSYGQARNKGGRQTRRPSRFLEGIWPAGEGTATRPSRQQTARRLDDELRALDADPALFERLKAWRLEVARAKGKPAFTIFADSTLVAVATAAPRTLQQLGLLRGIGSVKLAEYGPSILAIVRGEEPQQSVAGDASHERDR